MRVFSLTSKEDLQMYAFSLFFFMIPVFFVLLVLYFLYTPIFIEILVYIFNFIKNFPTFLQWIIFTIIPGLTIKLLISQVPRTIFIDKDVIEIEYITNGQEKIKTSDVKEFIAYKTTTPWTWTDLSKEINYSSLVPITIKQVTGEKINLFMKGEVWNALKTNSPEKPIVQISVLNRYSFFLALIAILNLANIIVCTFVATGGR